MEEDEKEEEEKEEEEKENKEECRQVIRDLKVIRFQKVLTRYSCTKYRKRVYIQF